MLVAILLQSLISLMSHGNEDVELSQTTDLTGDVFDTLVRKETDWFLMFHAPWCGHCKKFKPKINKVAVKFKGRIEFGLVDCTIERALCDRFDVRSYPTLKYHRAGEFHVYESSRTEEHVSFFCERMLLPDVIAAKRHEVEDMLKTHPENVVFTLVGEVTSTIREEIGEIAHRLRPVSMSPNFISVSSNAIPGVQLENGLVVLKHGTVREADLSASTVKSFVEEHQEPQLINFNMWWRGALKKSDMMTMVVLSNTSEKFLYLKYLLKLEEEKRTPQSDGRNEFTFGYVVDDDGGDMSKLLAKSFNVEFSEAPLLLMYDTYNMRYLTSSLTEYEPSTLPVVFEEMMLSSDWVEMLGIIKKFSHKANKFIDGLTTTHRVILIICILGGFFVFIYYTSESYPEDTPTKKTK